MSVNCTDLSAIDKTCLHTVKLEYTIIRITSTLCGVCVRIKLGVASSLINHAAAQRSAAPVRSMVIAESAVHARPCLVHIRPPHRQRVLCVNACHACHVWFGDHAAFPRTGAWVHMRPLVHCGKDGVAFVCLRGTVLGIHSQSRSWQHNANISSCFASFVFPLRSASDGRMSSYPSS